MGEHTTLYERCYAFVDEQSCGEWDSKTIREDATKLHAFIVSAPAVADLVKALDGLIADIEDYERINNLAPTPGKKDCWQSVTRAKESLSRFRELEKGNGNALFNTGSAT